MGPILVFLLGGGVALATQLHIKKAARSAARGAIRAGRSLSKSVAELREDLEDVSAEVAKTENGTKD